MAYSIYIQRVCTVYDHVYNVPIVQGNPISRMLSECPISQYSCGCWALYLVLVIRRVPNHSSWTACVGLFKLSTCSSLLIRRGHSTWFGAQTLTQLWYSNSILLVIPLHMTTWFNYTYGVGIQLNIDCTFNVDRVSYSVYCLFRSFMLFTLGVYI